MIIKLKTKLITPTNKKKNNQKVLIMKFKVENNNCAFVICVILLQFSCIFYGVGKCDLISSTESLFGDIDLDTIPFAAAAGDNSIIQQDYASTFITSGAAAAAYNADISIASFSTKRLLDILKRGKDLLKFLPRLGIVVAGKILDFIPTPSEILNFGKQTLVGFPQEVIAYAIDSVCKYIFFIVFGEVFGMFCFFKLIFYIICEREYSKTLNTFGTIKIK